MKHLRLFFALFAMLALGVGNAWGAEATITFEYNGSDVITNNTYSTTYLLHRWTATSTDGTIIYAGGKTSNANGGSAWGLRYANNRVGEVIGNIEPSYDASASWKTKIPSGAVGAIPGNIKQIKVFFHNATSGTRGCYILVSKNQIYADDLVPNTTPSGATKSSKLTSNDYTATPASQTYETSDGYKYFGVVSANSSFIGIKSIVVTYETAGSTEEPAYSVTVTQPAEGGSIEADKNEAKAGDIVKLTATPDEGYKFSAWDVKDASSNPVSVDDANGQFTMPESNVTVTASFVEKTKHTISWSVNGATKTLTPANVYEGDALGTLPTLDPSDICTGKVFVGWTTEANKDYNDATVAPELITKDTKPSGNTTYYAVYATEGEGAAEPEEVTWSYDFSSFSGTSVQYKEETHDLGGGVTINIKDCNINDQLRIYSSDANNGYVISNKLPGTIKLMEFNAGHKVDALVVYGSTDGSTWNQVGKVSVTSTSYKDYTLSFGATNYTYFKLDVEGTQQIRVAKMSITYMSEGGVTTTYSDYTTSCGATPTIYDVTIAGDIQNGTVTASPTSAAEGATITLTVTPADGYMLNTLAVADESSNSISLTDNTFEMPASNVTVSATFKEIPAATLTLSKNGETEDITSYKQGDKVELPSITSDCVKKFVGWSADANCTTDPEYKAGDEYTLTATAQTLYAVYATVGAGEILTITPSAVSGSADPYTFTIDAAGYSLTAKKNGGSTAPAAYPSAKDVRIYAKGTLTLTAPKALNKIVFNLSEQGKKRLAPITASVGTIATQASGDATVTWTGDATEVTFTVGDIAEFGSENTKAGQLCFGTITVTTAGSYSGYSTTCSAALANPTFSLAEGKYTEAKSVEIEYTEGTVYYTMDGTEPTASSTEYTAAIALNDCGEYTIKAIAISSDSQSDVVSATYTIKLPLTNSQAAPYTEAEAIAVYDGGCYDNQDVYVKGTVKTASFNSTYGNYTITLTNGFQFYRFLQAAETKFTEDIIVPGDVLIACGKLSKHQTTYQLAEGCYLVERIPYEGEKTDISNTEATAYTVDKAFELIADVKSDLTKEVYVKGLVAVAPTELYEEKYLTYSISDNGQNSGNVLKVYDGLDINGVAFTSKDDVKVGDYVVVKGKLLNYKGTYEINKDNQLVQHIKAATITIADITMEVGETKTIAATITPDAAKTEVTYSIKAGSDDCITLSENNITAKAEGTATIVATIATAEGEYMGKTVEFTVTVTPESTSDEVVILAELDGKWYAMKGAVPSGKSNQLDAIEVTYFNGTLYNVPDEVKASITWTRSVVDGKATFVNNGKYLKGGTSTDLTLVGTVDNNCKWMWNDENGYYTTNTSGTIRTFLYRENYNFKNYGVSQAGEDNKDGNYGNLPVVTAPVYTTGDVTYTRTTTAGKFGTICLPFGSTNYTGAEFFEFVGSETGKVYIGSVDELVAGVPYIFLASAAKVVVTSDGTTAATPGDHNGLHGTFTDDTEVAVGNYILLNNELRQAEATCWVNAYRAYIVMSEVPTGVPTQMPGRRYISMDAKGENAATSIDNITNDENTTIKVIENGQLIIIRNGEKFNAQGVRL